MGRRSLGPSLAWMQGEGADAISSQGTIKVAALPGGPGCLQCSPGPRSLLPLTWAARPGYAPPGREAALWSPALWSLALFSSARSSLSSLSFLPLVGFFFFFSSSLPLPLSLPHSFFFPFTVSHSLLIFPPFSFHHPCSLYLFIPMTFWSLSLFPLCFSSSFPLSSSAIWLFLCLTLNPQNAATQGPEGPALRPREGWPCPL